MNIFIWSKYDYIEVYKADTIEELHNIYAKIVTEINDWGLDSDIDMMNNYLTKQLVYVAEEHYRKAINHLLRKIKIGSHEAFEHGTGFSKLIG